MTFPSQLFLDGGDPEETAAADALLKSIGYHGLDGQTTNPSLIAKQFAVKHASGDVKEEDIVDEYRRVVTEMAKVTNGPISIQVTTSPEAFADEMLTQARERISWIPNGVIKFPCTEAGLSAASTFAQTGPVNITLVFSQEQAMAVHGALRAAKPDVPLFLSPFVGRLDDRGENGMDVVSNILTMYRQLPDRRVRVLTASVRTLDHLLYAFALGSEVVTVPFGVLKQWIEGGASIPDSERYRYDRKNLTPIPYVTLPSYDNWHRYNLHHDLTAAGITKFWDDWKGKSR